MSSPRQSLRRVLGWEVLLLVVPVLALVGFGFLALRWETRVQEEELRIRCQALVDPVRREFFIRLGQENLLAGLDSGSSIERPPLPGERSESLGKFEAGEFGAVLGEAKEFSEAGLPLRPLAALRLLRVETDPKRLEELTAVMVAEPSLVTPRMLEAAESRHREMKLPLPTILAGWRERLKNAERVRRLLGGADPAEFLSGGDVAVWLSDGLGEVLLVRTPEGLVLSDKEQVDLAATGGLTQAFGLPGGVGVDLAVQGSLDEAENQIFADDAYPAIRFHVSDAATLNRITARRRPVFVVFLVSATVLAVLGLYLLRRTVLRERELSERKGNLVAAVSHEMRTPVASIRLMAENLARGAVQDGEREKHLGRLVEQSERLSTLVENVLSYSKREAGKSDLRREAIEVADLTGEASGSFKALAENRGVVLRCEVEDFATPPTGDREALREALMNLIDNALKHSPEGGEVVCGAESGTATDGTEAWRLWVEDSGPGVKEEERARIFEAFYRVGSELRRETTGTGLGLALVKQVADLHGGVAECREGSSGGALFELILPLDPCKPLPEIT